MTVRVTDGEGGRVNDNNDNTSRRSCGTYVVYILKRTSVNSNIIHIIVTSVLVITMNITCTPSQCAYGCNTTSVPVYIPSDSIDLLNILFYASALLNIIFLSVCCVRAVCRHRRRRTLNRAQSNPHMIMMDNVDNEIDTIHDTDVDHMRCHMQDVDIHTTKDDNTLEFSTSRNEDHESYLSQFRAFSRDLIPHLPPPSPTMTN